MVFVNTAFLSAEREGYGRDRAIQQWQCLDPHTGEDLAGEIRQ